MTLGLDADDVLYGDLLPTDGASTPQLSDLPEKYRNGKSLKILSPQMENILRTLDQTSDCTMTALHGRVRPTIVGPRYLQGENSVEYLLHLAEEFGLVRSMPAQPSVGPAQPLSQSSSPGPGGTYWMLTDLGRETIDKNC